jgi:hypothetical protein
VTKLAKIGLAGVAGTRDKIRFACGLSRPNVTSGDQVDKIGIGWDPVYKNGTGCVHPSTFLTMISNPFHSVQNHRPHQLQTFNSEVNPAP